MSDIAGEPSKRLPLSEKSRAALARVTGLAGNELDQLIDELEVSAGVYDDHTSEDAIRDASEAAKWYDEYVRAREELVRLAEQRPAGAIIGGPLDIRALQLDALGAKANAELHRVKQRRRKNPRPRQRMRGTDLSCRNWLARKARKAVEHRCPELAPHKLREAIVIVLEAVGVSYPDPKKHVAEFEAMMQEPKEAAREKQQAEREERLRDRSI